MNTQSIEIELRYTIADTTELANFLASCTKLHQKHDVDIYLDTVQGILYERGIFIRIRNNKTLDIKFNRACLDNPDLSLQDYCEEHNFSPPLQEHDITRLNTLARSLGLKPIDCCANLECFKEQNYLGTYYIVDKVRTSYKKDMFTIAIDEVLDLGIFLEIELMTDNTDTITEVKKSMQQLLSPLTLEPLKTGYGTLLLRKNNFDHYLKGRFILEQDKINRKQSIT